MSETLTHFEGETFEAVIPQLEDHILTVTLNRPQRRNAINDVMVDELLHLLSFAKHTRAVRVVVLAASGDVFCAGGDLKALSGEPQPKSQSTIPHLGEVDDMVIALYHLNKPVIARIQGPVLAGALLMVCNATHAIASDRATFSAPEIKRGLWPFQVMAGLFRILPRRDATDFIMRGQMLSARRAAELGLVNEAVPHELLSVRVGKLAQELASYAPATMQAGLKAMRDVEMASFDDALPDLKSRFFTCVASDDAKEGMAAFFEKRAPVWKD
ncbi:enoyl-CoA hydratase/isomerase family protein [Altererythrobacter sp.]|uniref:enoyl-CoA hydratase/isomerase family protein n=1 Tax=Altererythrobacter sp. TaxID=1872480 RepID=UPI003D090C03